LAGTMKYAAESQFDKSHDSTSKNRQTDLQQ
jgi:hypothetical protein